MTAPSTRQAAGTAFFAAFANALAGLSMLLALRPGLPEAGSVPGERLAYVSTHQALWQAGWFCWHVAALSLAAFYVCLALRWHAGRPLATTLALMCAAAGLAADLSAEAIYMGIAPRLGVEGFALAEQVTSMLSGYLGNGLYSFAGLLLTWAGNEELPGLLVAGSMPVWGAGFLLSAACLAGSPALQVIGTAVLMPGFIVWAAAMGLWLLRRGS